MKLVLLRLSTVLCLLYPWYLTAQPTWFGSFESNADFYQLPHSRYLIGYHKLRLDFESRPDERLHLGANVNMLRYWGHTSLQLGEFLVLDSLWLNGNVWEVRSDPVQTLMTAAYSYGDSIYLDNFYLTWESGRWSLTLGKQQLSFGSGYAWNPTDLFNYKDVLDPAYEQTGITAVRNDLQLGLRTRFTAVVRPGQSWSQTGRYCQIKTGLGSFDVALQYHQLPWSLSTLEIVRLGPISGIVPLEHELQRQMLGASFSGELLGMGWHGELAWNRFYDNPAFAGDYMEGLLGWDYTTSGGTSWLVEYFYNGTGAPASDYYDLLYGMRYFNREIHSYHQNYLFLNLLAPWHDYQVGGFIIADLDDNSWLLSPSIQMDLASTTWQLIWMIGQGPRGTEFGMLDYQLRLRLKAYF